MRWWGHCVTGDMRLQNVYHRRSFSLISSSTPPHPPLPRPSPSRRFLFIHRQQLPKNPFSSPSASNHSCYYYSSPKKSFPSLRIRVRIRPSSSSSSSNSSYSLSSCSTSSSNKYLKPPSPMASSSSRFHNILPLNAVVHEDGGSNGSVSSSASPPQPADSYTPLDEGPSSFFLLFSF